MPPRHKAKSAANATMSAEPTSSSSSTPQFFLIKNEPDDYSLDDLANEPSGIGRYDGIRNFRARNTLKEMKVGDQVFFYHSSCKVPAIVGIAEVAKEAYPDFHSWDSSSKYFDEKSTAENPRWFMVDLRFVRRTKREISLTELKTFKDGPLQGMLLLTIPRLSVQKVTPQHWQFILGLEESNAADQPPAQPETKIKLAKAGTQQKTAPGKKTGPSKADSVQEAKAPKAAQPAHKRQKTDDAESTKHRGAAKEAAASKRKR